MLTLEEKIKNLPENPGCYIMSDEDGNVIYVGKAKNLKNRVRQYFFSLSDRPVKVSRMVEKIADFRYIVTESETDALSLENNLIKQYKPPYNILLKDDKQYPYLKIDVKNPYPKITMTRKPVKDGSRYFGPIMGGSVKDMFRILEVFKTATCKFDLSKIPDGFRPCLNADVGACSAPCAGKVTKEEYREQIERAIRFLSGDFSEIKKLITDKMMRESEAMRYEQALECKKQLAVIEKMKETRLVNTGDDFDGDFFAVISNGVCVAVSQLIVRKGRLLGGDNYELSDAGLTKEQSLSDFLNGFYDVSNLDVRTIYLNVSLPDEEALSKVLSERKGRNIRLIRPQRGEKHRLILMAEDNARVYLDKNQTKLDRDFNVTVGAMEHLKEALRLPRLPRRVECYDISNVSGVDKVASMTVFKDGLPDRKSYRRFRIKTVEGADDFRSMRETLYRRFMRMKEGDAKFGEDPDLIVIDGGKGQLAFAVEAMDEAGVSVPIVSLAKREEWVFLPDNPDPVILPRNSFGLNLLINIRDEAHRFAITYFRGLHGKNMLVSELDSVYGVGKKRQSALMRKFRSLEALENATVEELLSVQGMNEKSAVAVYEHFHGKESLPQTKEALREEQSHSKTKAASFEEQKRLLEAQETKSERQEQPEKATESQPIATTESRQSEND